MLLFVGMMRKLIMGAFVTAVALFPVAARADWDDVKKSAGKLEDTGKKATNEGASQASTTQPEQPVRGGTLVAALTADPGSLNPAVTSNGSVHSAMAGRSHVGAPASGAASRSWSGST